MDFTEACVVVNIVFWSLVGSLACCYRQDMKGKRTPLTSSGAVLSSGESVGIEGPEMTGERTAAPEILSAHNKCSTDQPALGFNRTIITRVKKILQCILQYYPSTLRQCLNDAFTYIFFTQNSIFQVLYIFLCVTGHLMVISDGLAIMRHVHPETNHLLCPLALLALNLALFALCCCADPGVLCAQNCGTYAQVYAYDERMYTHGVRCDTCGIVKPARSKHCRVYDRCIYKFDHYCIWIRNVVGGNNHRYFLALLASLAVMCVHGAWATCNVLCTWAEAFGMRRTVYRDISTGERVEPTNYVVFVVLSQQFPRLMFIATSLVVLSCLVVAFLCYHAYLAASNQTTNERYKTHGIDNKLERTVARNFYNRGIWKNLQEECFPLHGRIRSVKSE